MNIPRNPLKSLCLFCCAAAGLAQANVQTHLVSVSLYEGLGAFVRSGTVQASDLSADGHLHVTGLPARIQPDSLWLTLNAVPLTDFAFRRLPDAELPRSPALEDAAEQLARIDATIADLDAAIAQQQRRLDLYNDAAKAFIDAMEEGAATSPEGLEPILSLIESTDAALRALQAEQRPARTDLARQRTAAANHLAQLERQHRQLNGALTARIPSGLTGELRIGGLFSGANWNPTYDLNATLDGSIRLAFHALIRNQTGEDWSDVDLELLTGSVTGGTQAPQLSPWHLDRPQPIVTFDSAAKSAPQSRNALMAESVMAFAAAPPAEAEIQSAGLQVSLRAPAPVSVSGDGQPQRVFLLNANFAADLWTEVVPARAQTGFLHARWSHDGDAPILGGEVRLNVEGRYTGSGFLQPTQPGDDIELGLGINPTLSVVRTPITIPRERRGVFGKVQRLERKFLTTIHNLNAIPQRLRVTDQFPLPKDEAIKVQHIAPKDANPDPATGIFHSELTLAPNQITELTTHFQVEVPEDWPIQNWLP